MLDFNDKALGLLCDAPKRLEAIIRHATPQGVVEESERMCERFDCDSTGLSRVIALAKSVVPDARPATSGSAGVGTELSKLIPEWATQFKGKCGCKDMAKKMDDRGVNWCEINSLSIVAHLLSQSEHLIPAFKLVPTPVKKIVAERLLRKAITNAKENHES